jgi:peptidylprolyl isomerase
MWKTLIILMASLGLFLPQACGQSEHWREVAPEDLLLITTIHGVTVVELNADFAPGHTARLRELVRAGFYDGEYFYRVIDGFVAQGGVQHDERMGDWAGIANENDRALREGTMSPLGNDDLFAQNVGHSADGFAMAQDSALGREWLLHCPGAMAMARDNDPESGGTEFYITLAPQRYLDRNLTIFGRVIDGMQYLQKLERGNRAIESGVIQPPRTGDKITSMQMAADLPEDKRPTYLVQRPGTDTFEASKTARRVRTAEFFYRKPPEVLDICSFDVPVRKLE